jgi:serine/threonine-protein kinase
MVNLFSMESRSPAGLVIADTYRVLDRLGGGGMGEVYAAEHVRTGKPVAVKLLRTELGHDDKAVKRFQREARALASVNSEHVVSILDCGTLPDGAPYLVMERLMGQDLRALLGQACQLPLGRALHIVLGACRGLSALHATGLIHRDLKPANLFIIARDDGHELCKILDLGVAKLDTSAATHQGAVIGTIRYMAPEQLTDSSSVGPESDVYALGAVLYECVAGKPPHPGDTIQELMFNILNRDPPPPSRVVADLPVNIDRVVERALARDPSKRFRTARALGIALESLLRGTYRPGEDSLHTRADDSSLDLPRARALRQRGRLALLGGALGCAALGAALAWGVGRSVDSPRQVLIPIVRRAVAFGGLPAIRPSEPAAQRSAMPNVPNVASSMVRATTAQPKPQQRAPSAAARPASAPAERPGEQSSGSAPAPLRDGWFGGRNPYADEPAATGASGN